MFFKDYTVLVRRLLFALVFFVFYRIAFYFFNLSYFLGSNASVFETIYAFIYGLRFDVATVLIANIFFIIISIIPFTNYSFQILKKIIFVFFNSAFLVFLVADLEFFSFLGKKITIDIFTGGMGKETGDQLFQIAFNYWYCSLLIVLNIILLYKFYPRRKKDVLLIPFLPWYKVLVSSFVFFFLTAVGIRGGVQIRSISPKEAFIHDKYELGNLTINSAYTFVRSFKEKKTPIEKFFVTDKMARDVLIKSRSFENGFLGEHKKDNVIIILLESFSQEYIDEGYAPFFSELKDKGLYFSNNFANGRRSIEVLPSVMTSLPSMLDMPISQSRFQSNQFFALPKILKENGYKTAFYHGGQRGTMDFDSYAYSIGFEKYFALEDYPNQNHYDGHWGVYDHHYLDYFADEMDSYQTPFFTSIFTLSSHQPYSIPKELMGKFRKGSLEIHESIGYVDFALNKFFEKVKNKKWFKDTLFIITADHTSKLDSEKYNNLLGRYRVPLLFYHPSIDLSHYNSEKVTQHVDILPSVVDFLGIDNEKRLYYGSSVFLKDNGRAINYNSGAYLYVSPPYVLKYNRVRPVLSKLVDGKLEEVIEHEAIFDQMLNELKAYIQYTNNGLKNNNIYSL